MRHAYMIDMHARDDDEEENEIIDGVCEKIQ